MPTYEYACRSCGTHLEVVQRFTDDPLTECPACGGTLRKVYGQIGIVFKGNGFYKTDNRPASSSATADGSATGSDKTGPASDPGKKAGKDPGKKAGKDASASPAAPPISGHNSAAGSAS